MQDYILEAIKAAPLMVVAFGGVFLISRLFLNAWQKNEQDRAKVMDQRHKTYFDQLEGMSRGMTQAMDRGTDALNRATDKQHETNELLGGLRELMRRINP